MATTSATARPATKVKVKKVGSHRLAAGDYNSQVKAESFLRTNPERSQLRATLDDVIHERDATVRTARVAAQGAIQTARAGVPALNAVQADALSSINPALESSPGAARETDRTRIRLAERLGQAMTDLQAREQDATAGRMYAVNAANDRAATNAGKIRDRLIGLSQEEGAFAQQRAAELARQDDSDALKVATTKRFAVAAGAQLAAVGGYRPGHGVLHPGRQAGPEGEGARQGRRREGADAGAVPQGAGRDHACARLRGEVQEGRAVAARGGADPRQRARPVGRRGHLHDDGSRDAAEGVDRQGRQDGDGQDDAEGSGREAGVGAVGARRAGSRLQRDAAPVAGDGAQAARPGVQGA
jgi:hypothetical protein